MKALQFNRGDVKLSLQNVAKPAALEKGEVLIRVKYAGVCGTDLHIVDGSFPCREAPVVLGHEFSGVVEALGAGVSHLSVGDSVAVDSNSGCSACLHCAKGNYHYCETKGFNSYAGIFRDGGWAEYAVYPGTEVFKLPTNVTLEQGVLAEPLSCVFHGWDRVAPVPVGSQILIQGAGIIGNLWAALLHSQGHRSVVVSEPQQGRRDLVLKLETGFDVITPEELKRRKLSDPAYGFDLIVDCSGYGPAIQVALDLLNCGGKLCIFGVASPEAKVSISPYEFFKKELSITSVYLNQRGFANALALLNVLGTRYFDYNKLGIKVFALEQYEEAINELKSGSIAKAVFKIN